jgi:germination protein M
MWKKKTILLLAVSLVLLSAAACGKQKEAKPESAYQIYDVNYDNTGVIAREYKTESTEMETVLSELIAQLGKASEKLEYNAPLSGDVNLLDYSFSDGQLVLNFDSRYKNQEMITEILTRAAIVRTLSQIKEVQYVSFLVEGITLTDASGNVVGVMSPENFIDNAGDEISTYEKVRLRLYFADETGSRLVPVSRTRVYNSNISVERLIVEEIIAGPQENDTGISTGSGAYPVVNPGTRILSVNVRDGICYVNLDSTFSNQIYNVTPEVTVYALTNSLAELSNVNKVQILINGETNINYRENISLSTIFERNLDLVD